MLEKLQTFEEFPRIKNIKFYKNGIHRLERVIKANLDHSFENTKIVFLPTKENGNSTP